ncbi:MAG: YtxH domain-containing protein [Arachidicoccus sp.]|nr:YtxH domain-containing protein [Arachidicoccus sp.]
MSAKQILAGTISGIIAGAIVGIVLAPQSGEETRKQIADSASDLKKKLKKLTGKSVDELNDLQDVFKSEIAGLSDDVREKVLHLINKSKASAQAVADELHDND